MKRLLAFMLLLVLVGCGTSAPEPTEAPIETATPTLSPVYTDWSKLTPYAQQVYGRHAAYSAAGPLTARDDYGVLLPYLGQYAHTENYVIDGVNTYGLVTEQGELVTGAAYSYIDCMEGILMLRQDGTGGERLTLAAADGRWVRELGDAVFIGDRNGLLMTGAADGSLDLWNGEGELMHFDGALLASRLGERVIWNAETVDRPSVAWTDDRLGYLFVSFFNGKHMEQPLRLYLDFTDGTVTDTPPEGYPAEIDHAALYPPEPEAPTVEGCAWLTSITDAVTGERYFFGYYRENEAEEGRNALFDGAGGLLAENVTEPYVRAGLVATQKNGFFCYRALADNALRFRYAIRTNSD